MRICKVPVYAVCVAGANLTIISPFAPWAIEFIVGLTIVNTPAGAPVIVAEVIVNAAVPAVLSIVNG